MQQHGFTRRRILALGGTTVAGGIGLIALGSDTARAEVKAKSFSIDDIEHYTEGQEVTDVQVAVTAEYAYESTKRPTKATLTLSISQLGDSPSEIATVELSELLDSDSGTKELSGSILQTYHYTQSDFNPSEGNSKSLPVTVHLTFTLYNNGKELAAAEAMDDARIEVTNDEITATTEVGGSGGITIQH